MTLNKFDDINHLPLRVFNRVVFANNLLQDGGKDAVARYIELFTDEEKKMMYVMGAYIKKRGEANVRKEVTRNLVLVDENYNHAE